MFLYIFVNHGFDGIKNQVLGKLRLVLKLFHRFLTNCVRSRRSFLFPQTIFLPQTIFIPAYHFYSYKRLSTNNNACQNFL